MLFKRYCYHEVLPVKPKVE